MVKKKYIGLYPKLTVEERYSVLDGLIEEQRAFLLEEVKRSRKTIYARVMQNEKITAIRAVDVMLMDDEKNVVDWEIVDYIDFGKYSREGRCACGLSLRHQFTVKHQGTGRYINFGIGHLSEFLNIDENEIKGFINELNVIDYELDELLFKIQCDEYGYEFYELLFDKSVVSAEIQRHIDMKVPLLDRQVRILEKLYNEHIKVLFEEKQKEIERQRLGEINDNIEELEKKRKLYEEKFMERRLVLEERERVQALERAIQVKKVKDKLPVWSSLSDIVYHLVLNGVHSAVEISWILVKEFGKDGRMSLGTIDRPYIYYDVLLALSKHVEIGNLIRDELSDMYDCFFYVVSNRDGFHWEDNEVDGKVFVGGQQVLF